MKKAESISKKELALRYNPHLKPHSAVNKLMAWIEYCNPLYEALKKTGYKNEQKKFTSMQVGLIYYYLCEP